MRCNLILGIATILLSGCNPAPRGYELDEAKKAISPPSQPAAEQATLDYFRDVLRDPDSAKFEFWPIKNGVWATPGGGRFYGWFMCGKLNAKNAYGGFTGYKTFLVYFDPANPAKVDMSYTDADCSWLYGEAPIGLTG